MKGSFYCSRPITKPKIKEHLASNFRPYHEWLEGLSVKAIEQEAFTEIYNKLSARIGQINFPEVFYYLPLINQEDRSIEAVLRSCVEIRKDLSNYLPEHDYDGYFTYSEQYKEVYNIELEAAKKVIKFAYNKRNLNLLPTNNQDGCYKINEIIEKLITFSMLHLQSPIGITELIENNEINILKNEIYQTISEKVVIPYLAECFKTILQKEDVLSLDSTDLFDMIMVFASDYRGRIAHMQTDPSAYDMGAYTRGNSMSDPLDNPNWKPWKDKIAEKIKTAIASNSEEITLGYKESMCIDLRGGAKYMPKGIWHHKDDFTDTNPTNSHSSCYHFAYKQPLLNEAIEPLTITCVHKKFSQNQILELGNDLKDILSADKSLLSEEGSKMFAAFLWDISGGSFLARGQAAVTQYIMKALAMAKGYILNWSEEWTPPLHPNYDMQALSEFYKDIFIEEHSHNIILTEIIDEAVLVGEI